MVGPAGCWVLAGTAAPAGSAPSPVGSGELAEPVGCWPGWSAPVAATAAPAASGPADVAFSTTVGSVGLAATPGCCSVPAAPVDPAEPA
ncbi:Uncharacterised protein [Mycobacterium tuberculosis]|nr:Uncharacterised protein [Mycobacterium tuberculosis]